MMHHGMIRVAICFLAKFGMLYFFLTSVAALFSMYILIIYFTSTISDVTDHAGNGNKPMAPQSQPAPRTVQQSLLNSAPHIRLSSNLKYLHTSLSNSAEGTINYSLDLMAYVREYSVLPSCGQNTFLNILITSAPRNFRQRNVIRQTWCSKNMTRRNLVGHPEVGNPLIRCTFLLGKSLSSNIQHAVEDEAKGHQDMLIGTYLDSYRNLTIKVLQGLAWDFNFCPAKYVLKTDDDCFVNVPVLKSILYTEAPARNLYVGYVMERTDVIRNPTSKWHVLRAEYAPDHYPAYVSGSGYLLSGDLIELVVSLYASTYLIPVEDAYIGILLNSVGVTPVHSDRFSVRAQWQLCNLLYFIVIHQVSVETQTHLLNQSILSYSECSRKYDPRLSLSG